jgi:ATP-dependent Clp protease adapter protein ClpS
VHVLVVHFGLDVEPAHAFAKQVHAEGSARVGWFPFRLATKLVAKATKDARAAGFPLRITVEPA